MLCLAGVGHLCRMIEVEKTEQFLQWFEALRSPKAQIQIVTRLSRLALGNPGVHRVLDAGIVELKVDHGAGYRVYYTRVGHTRLLVLRGGTKQTQQGDIEAARRAAKQLRS